MYQRFNLTLITLVLQLLREAGDWKGLQESILLLSKRRGQLKQAVQDMVRQCMAYSSEAPDKVTKIDLLKTLQAMTEGKVRLPRGNCCARDWLFTAHALRNCRFDADLCGD